MAVLEDLLAPGLKIVFCGTGAGRRSAELKAYYAGRGNRFWPTLFATGLTPEQVAPERFRELLRFGIGLTDIAKEHVGPDAELDASAADARGLEARIATFAPRYVAFTSKRAASLFFGCGTGAIAYGRQERRIGLTELWVLPSPSGAARGSWSIDWWRALSVAAG